MFKKEFLEIPPTYKEQVRLANRREASEAALDIIKQPNYTMQDYERLADQIFNWLEKA